VDGGERGDNGGSECGRSRHRNASGSRNGKGAGARSAGSGCSTRDAGRYASIGDIAAGEKIDRGYVGSLLRLTLLSPDIVEAILDGRPPEEFGLPALLTPFPVDCGRQRVEFHT
jgi:hypothetical protein